MPVVSQRQAIFRLTCRNKLPHSASEVGFRSLIHGNVDELVPVEGGHLFLVGGCGLGDAAHGDSRLLQVAGAFGVEASLRAVGTAGTGGAALCAR